MDDGGGVTLVTTLPSPCSYAVPIKVEDKTPKNSMIVRK